MGCWDELCLLCGVSGSGPRDIAHRDIATEAKTIADEICPGNVELVQILEQALRIAEEGEQDGHRDDKKPWLVNGLGYNGYAEDYIAIGCFDDENIGFAPMREGKAPRGEHVEVRRVDGISSGSFTQVVVERDGRQVKENRDTNCSATDSAGMPNVWLDSRCYHYLESWVDWKSVPAPSKHHISSRPPLESFASELYEMIYSRKRQRGEIIVLNNSQTLNGCPHAQTPSLASHLKLTIRVSKRAWSSGRTISCLAGGGLST